MIMKTLKIQITNMFQLKFLKSLVDRYFEFPKIVCLHCLILASEFLNSLEKVCKLKKALETIDSIFSRFFRKCIENVFLRKSQVRFSIKIISFFFDFFTLLFNQMRNNLLDYRSGISINRTANSPEECLNFIAIHLEN